MFNSNFDYTRKWEALIAYNYVFIASEWIWLKLGLHWSGQIIASKKCNVSHIWTEYGKMMDENQKKNH